MSDPFIAEIKIFAGNFAPRGYAFCSGALLPISQNTALFSLIGTIYGGDGRTTFGLPTLRGRAAMHPGNGPGLSNRRLGEKSGVDNVTLLTTQMATHTHTLTASGAPATLFIPNANTSALARANGNAYQTNTAANLVSLAPETILNNGTLGPHNNRQPLLALSFIIALVGIFPSRN